MEESLRPEVLVLSHSCDRRVHESLRFRDACFMVLLMCRALPYAVEVFLGRFVAPLTHIVLNQILFRAPLLGPGSRSCNNKRLIRQPFAIKASCNLLHDSSDRLAPSSFDIIDPLATVAFGRPALHAALRTADKLHYHLLTVSAASSRMSEDVPSYCNHSSGFRDFALNSAWIVAVRGLHTAFH